MRKSMLITSALLAVLSLTALGNAAVTNGGFESGDFTGWNMFPDNLGHLAAYSVITNLGSVVPTEGTRMAMVQGVDFPDGNFTDFNGLYTDPFDWTQYDEVCFDIKILFQRMPFGLFPSDPFEAVADFPPDGQPILAAIRVDGYQQTYDTINFISGEQVFDIPILSGGDTGFTYMTDWETFCFDPSQISDNGDPDWDITNTPLLLWLIFDQVMYQDAAEVAFLIDRAVGGVAGCVDYDGDGYGNPASSNCPHAELDCDDHNSQVNPGMTEIPKNGLDDDCNPATPPKWGPPMSTVDVPTGSHSLNWLAMLLLPAAGVLVWKRRVKK